MKSFAIVIVCYNRILGIQRLLKQLEKVDYDGRKDITLIFSIDNSGSDIVENFAKNYNWIHGKKRIRTFSKRQGLKNHILQCGDFTYEYDIISVLEDDIFVSDSFYHYAYQSAEFYWDNDKIAGISLYGFQKNWLNWLYRFEPQKKQYDAYFLKIAQSWGQVWTRRKWSLFKEWLMNNKSFKDDATLPQNLFTWSEKSWLKFHDRYCIETSRYFVYPYVSLSTNYSDPGEHATYSITDHQVELQYEKKEYSFPIFDEEAIIYDEFMERELLGKYLGIDEKELCVSLWGTKQKELYKRYLLTTKSLPYLVIKEFSLSLRPIELSVILNIPGEGIYLYDTSKKVSNNRRKSTDKLKIYSIRSHDVFQLLPFIIRFFVKDVCYRISLKTKKLKKRVGEKYAEKNH